MNQNNFIGKGANAEVYRCKINNIDLAVKCFKEYDKAFEENSILERIHKLIPNCPGKIKYYGMKKLGIEEIIFL